VLQLPILQLQLLSKGDLLAYAKEQLGGFYIHYHSVGYGTHLWFEDAQAASRAYVDDYDDAYDAYDDGDDYKIVIMINDDDENDDDFKSDNAIDDNKLNNNEA